MSLSNRAWLARAVLVVLQCLALVGAPGARAQDAREAEFEAASRAAHAAQIVGPADVALRDQAVLKLPAGYAWIPQPAAGQLMRAMGNSSDPRDLGLVFPAGDARWMVLAQYEPAGYIKDDDARDWNVDDLFKSLKEGTEAANQERKSRGFPELEIVGWIEKPAYDAATHRLVWSMSARHKGEAGDDNSVNYNTYALGRDGYITLGLITGQKSVDADKVHAKTLLAALNYNEGKRYSDFNASTDHVAEYGLAALVAGVAAKKLGLLAVAAAFFAKFAKVILLAVAGVGVAATKLFKRKQAPGAVQDTPPEQG